MGFKVLTYIYHYICPSIFFICLEKRRSQKSIRFLPKDVQRFGRGVQILMSRIVPTWNITLSTHCTHIHTYTVSMVRHITLRRFSYGKYWPPRARAPITRRIMYSFPRHCKCWFSVSRLHRRRGLLIWCGQI